MSSAKTTAFPKARLRLIARVIAQSGSRNAPLAPMPRSPSRITSDSPTMESSSAISARRHRAAAANFAFGNGPHSASGNAARSRTSHPHAARCRAATSASPPLFPFPNTATHTPDPGKNCRTARAICSPASSISASAERPSENARCSSSFIAAHVRIIGMPRSLRAQR